MNSEPTILFVDDEPITRRISTRLLSRYYSTMEADGVDSAMHLLEQFNEDISVLITDMRMPKKDGMELIQAVSQLYPKISIVASTGDLSKYDFPLLIEQKTIFAAIEKPWDKDTAIETVKSAVEAHQSIATD